MGLTVVDAGPIIALLDADDAHHDAARRALDQLRAQGDPVVLPAVAFAEVLVGPARHGMVDDTPVHRLVRELPMTVAPFDERTAAVAAVLRASHRGRMTMPDAMVVATAIIGGAVRLLTTDRGWPSAAQLSFEGTIETM